MHLWAWNDDPNWLILSFYLRHLIIPSPKVYQEIAETRQVSPLSHRLSGIKSFICICQYLFLNNSYISLFDLYR